MERLNLEYKTVLTIAGSDSGGCAGIQADIKSISANGAFATTAITAITSQNTIGVQHIFPIPSEHIAHQIKSVLNDITVNAIKIGMLHSGDVIKMVDKTLNEYPVSNIILDPVMVSTSGHQLIDDDAIDSLKAFIPKTTLITPNIPEAKILLNIDDINKKDFPEIAKAMSDLYKTSVLLKGGHIVEGESMLDVLYLYNKQQAIPISNPRINTKNTHGTGCSLSSAIAAKLALGQPLEDAVIEGISYLNSAILSGKDRILGKGNGPVDHFYKL